MRAVVQRVRSARVTVDERVVGEVGRGLLVFVAVERGDTAADAAYLASKIRQMRLFASDEACQGDDGARGRRGLDRSVEEVGGAVLIVSQFTLAADLRKGRRPSFDAAAPPDEARPLYEAVVEGVRAGGLPVETGEFQAMMQVALVNDGPVTILLDSRRRF